MVKSVKAPVKAQAIAETFMVGVCPKCRKTILLFSKNEHEDFHRAELLDGQVHDIERCDA